LAPIEKARLASMLALLLIASEICACAR